MVRKLFPVLCIFGLCLATVSCRELGKPTGPLTFETFKFADAIPQDYGPLIGVTQNPQNAGLVVLWFQKSDGTITAVSVNTHEGRIYDKVLKISRK